MARHGSRPSDLVESVTPPAGLVLDPTDGIGSTGVAALQLNHRFIGIELDQHYAQTARQRLRQTAAQTRPSRR